MNIFLLFETQLLLDSLKIMWQGMLGIFIVMILIALIVTGLVRFYAKSENRTKEDPQ